MGKNFPYPKKFFRGRISSGKEKNKLVSYFGERAIYVYIYAHIYVPAFHQE